MRTKFSATIDRVEFEKIDNKKMFCAHLEKDTALALAHSILSMNGEDGDGNPMVYVNFTYDKGDKFGSLRIGAY